MARSLGRQEGHTGLIGRLALIPMAGMVAFGCGSAAATHPNAIQRAVLRRHPAPPVGEVDSEGARSQAPLVGGRVCPKAGSAEGPTDGHRSARSPNRALRRAARFPSRRTRRRGLAIASSAVATVPSTETAQPTTSSRQRRACRPVRGDRSPSRVPMVDGLIIPSCYRPGGQYPPASGLSGRLGQDGRSQEVGEVTS